MTRATWPDMEALFENRGTPGSCGCMAWRQTAEQVRHTDRASGKRMMKLRVEAGTPVRLLAHGGDVPVAWCSVAPRETHRKGLVDPRPATRRSGSGRRSGRGKAAAQPDFLRWLSDEALPVLERAVPIALALLV